MNDLENLSRLIKQATASLEKATTAAEILEVHERAGAHYDAAKRAARFAKVKDAHGTMLATCHRMQADALMIEARAQCRLADEYDAAQDRGELPKRGGDRKSKIKLPNEKFDRPITAIGLTDKEINAARQLRDAEERKPGIIRKAMDAKLEAGEEPTRADVKRVTKKSKPTPRPRKNSPEAETNAAALVLDQGKSLEQAATETGVGSVQVLKVAVAREQGRRQGRAEPQIDPATLSISAQEKLAIATRQMERRLQASYDETVRVGIVDGTKEYLESYVIPHYAELEKRYRDIVDSRTRGIMDRKTYRLILSCLHTDSRQSASDEKLNEAFNLFSRMQTKLMSEADDPTPKTKIKWPTTKAEIDARMAEVKAERKAKKRGDQNGVARR